MGNRLSLHAILKDIPGVKEVYFQPPESIKLDYPCVIYARNSRDTKFADDTPYFKKIRYQVTIIDKNPDSIIPEKVAELPMCVFDRHYTANNLNHDIYNLYF